MSLGQAAQRLSASPPTLVGLCNGAGLASVTLSCVDIADVKFVPFVARGRCRGRLERRYTRSHQASVVMALQTLHSRPFREA